MKNGKLTGIIVPLVTPFDDDGKIDKPKLRDLTEHMISEGADYLMATALTGEGPLLSETETLDVWKEIFSVAQGRVNVVPAIISTRTDTAVSLAKAAHGMGACAIMVAPIVPELYAARSQKDVHTFYAEVSEATPLPIILFNYPSLTGVDLIPEFVARLSEIKTVSYIKESTGDSKRVHAIQRLCGSDFKVICGNPNAAFESIALGCDTWITGIMNVIPRSSKAMMDAILKHKNFGEAKRIYYEHVLPIIDAMSASNNPTGIIKAGLRARGIDVGIPRKPGSDVSDNEMHNMKKLIERIKADEAAF